MAARIEQGKSKLRITKLICEPYPRQGKTASRYAGKLIISGLLIDSGSREKGEKGEQGGEREKRDPEKALDEFIASLEKEKGYYTPEMPRFPGPNQFTLTVNVERREPKEWKLKIQDRL